MKTFYVYEDWTLEETPRCFYVGKGDDDRVARLKRSSERHSEIVVSLGQRRVVSFSTQNEIEALDAERHLIKERHTHLRDPEYNGIGCNRTLGGQGNSGRIVTDETKRRISEVKKGKRPNKIWSDKERRDTSERMSKLHKGKTISDDHRSILVNRMANSTVKADMINKVSQSLKEKYQHDPEFAQRIRDMRVGDRNGRAILTEQNVRDIRAAWDTYDASARGATKKFCVEHAEKFDVTGENIFRIVHRKSWKHV